MWLIWMCKQFFNPSEKKGEARMCLLQCRFGDMPAWVNEKITQADLPTLEAWGLRFVDAQSLEDVFGSR